MAQIETVHLDSAIDDTNLATVFLYSDTGSAAMDLPKKWNIVDQEAFSQYLHEDSYCSCGLYGNRQGINDQLIDNQDPYQWNAEAIKGWGLSPTSGWSMSLLLSFGQAKSWYNGWVRCANANEVKQVIFKNQTIVTGSCTIDFAKMRANEDNIAVRAPGPGHFFEINGYDDDTQLFRVKDSMGPKAWDGTGHFYIKYSDFDILYSCMARPTGTSVDQARIAQDNRTIQKAISLGITNGERLNATLKRYEAVLMVARAKRGSLDEKILLEQAKEAGIWDGNRPFDDVLRGEMMLMVAAFLGKRTLGNDEQTYLDLIKTGVTLTKDRERKAIREEGILLVTRAIDLQQ